MLDISIYISIMITEDYISFETAKLLKEKGFNEPCHALYHDGDDKIFFGLDVDSYYNTVLNVNCYACPTLQMVMKWLREVYKLNIATYPTRQMELVVGKEFVRQYSCDIFNDNEFVKSLEIITGYEEACEAAIKYCLENLI